MWKQTAAGGSLSEADACHFVATQNKDQYNTLICAPCNPFAPKPIANAVVLDADSWPSDKTAFGPFPASSTSGEALAKPTGEDNGAGPPPTNLPIDCHDPTCTADTPNDPPKRKHKTERKAVAHEAKSNALDHAIEAVHTTPTTPPAPDVMDPFGPYKKHKKSATNSHPISQKERATGLLSVSPASDETSEIKKPDMTAALPPIHQKTAKQLEHERFRQVVHNGIIH